MQKKKQKQCIGNHFLDTVIASSSLMGIWNAFTFNEWIWVSLIEFGPDPGFVSPVRSDPAFVSPVQSDPRFVSPIQSGPIWVLSTAARV